MDENKKIIDWDTLTAVIYATAEENNVPVGDGANMVQDNIRDGKETWPLRGSMPMKFVDMIPDWATMGGDQAVVDSNDGFNAWLRKMRANATELSSYWREWKCQHMVTLMQQSNDPGPIDGVRPGEE